MLPPVSVRQFAKLDGCSHTLVQKAIREGKLKVDAEGRLDPALAGSGWRKQNRRGNSGGNSPKVATPKVATSKVATPAAAAEKVATAKRQKPAATPSADEVEEAAEGLFAEEIEGFLDNVLAGAYADTATAERVKENALAAKHLLAARHSAGHLVEIEHAETVLFETQRAQRDAWMNFPTRIGPLLAAKIGVEADKVVEALTAHVHQQLADLGEPEADFTSKREG